MIERKKTKKISQKEKIKRYDQIKELVEQHFYDDSLTKFELIDAIYPLVGIRE